MCPGAVPVQGECKPGCSIDAINASHVQLVAVNTNRHAHDVRGCLENETSFKTLRMCLIYFHL